MAWDTLGLRHSFAQFSSMILTSRDPSPLGDSNDLKALNIVLYISAAVLIILLCTVAILHCILRRQQRQYVQSSPHTVVILRISHHSETCVQEKINHDNTVASIPVSKNTSFPKESTTFFHLSPSSLEKASDNDNPNRPTITRPVPSYTPPSYTPAGQSESIKLMDA